MRRHTPGAVRRWHAALILTIFALAVAAAAAAGWWYARESTPHQGPIVLISVGGLRPAELQAYGGTGGSPAIDALSAEAVVFERAYAHSPLTLPTHASILAGQLPFEHGVRDEAGFALKDDARSLPELLRNRGFDTGAAVSSFLLRPESGVAQGFTFFDAELPLTPDRVVPVVARDGLQTTDAAERWLRARRGHRFFLFVQIEEDAADATVTRIIDQLKELGLYDRATIVLTADRADAGAGFSLDESALHVPLLFKQPEGEGAGRRIAAPVQHIDLLPTVLDIVRAPIPSGLRGRSLRPVLDGDDTVVLDQPIYAETLAARFRFGGRERFTLIAPPYRYVRGGREEEVVDLDPARVDFPVPPAVEAAQLRTELDRLLEGHDVTPPSDIAAAEEDQFAALGYLGAAPLFDVDAEPLDPDQEARLVEMHRTAAMLASQKNYAGAIAQLRQIAQAHPRLAVIHYQLGTLLGRVGRLPEARRTFRAAAALAPDNPYVPIAVAGLLLRARQPEEAAEQAALAVALAEHHDSRSRAMAHEVAARVALAHDDFERALMHAESAEQDDPALPLRHFVRGRMLHADGRYEEALAAFEEAATLLMQERRTLEHLHLHLGQTLARLGRYADAEDQFRLELRAFPRSVQAYSSLALLYHASNRATSVAETLDALVEAVPTPEGYETAAGLWTSVGEPARAAALKSEARNRFRERPAARLSVRSDAR